MRAKVLLAVTCFLPCHVNGATFRDSGNYLLLRDCDEAKASGRPELMVSTVDTVLKRPANMMNDLLAQNIAEALLRLIDTGHRDRVRELGSRLKETRHVDAIRYADTVLERLDQSRPIAR